MLADRYAPAANSTIARAVEALGAGALHADVLGKLLRCPSSRLHSLLKAPIQHGWITYDTAAGDFCLSKNASTTRREPHAPRKKKHRQPADTTLRQGAEMSSGDTAFDSRTRSLSKDQLDATPFGTLSATPKILGSARMTAVNDADKKSESEGAQQSSRVVSSGGARASSRSSSSFVMPPIFRPVSTAPDSTAEAPPVRRFGDLDGRFREAKGAVSRSGKSSAPPVAAPPVAEEVVFKRQSPAAAISGPLAPTPTIVPAAAAGRKAADVDALPIPRFIHAYAARAAAGSERRVEETKPMKTRCGFFTDGTIVIDHAGVSLTIEPDDATAVIEFLLHGTKPSTAVEWRAGRFTDDTLFLSYGGADLHVEPEPAAMVLTFLAGLQR